MWGIKVIIPNKLQGRVLEECHTGHRNHENGSINVWWPGMDQQIKQMVQKCESCQSLRNRPAPTTLQANTSMAAIAH